MTRTLLASLGCLALGIVAFPILGQAPPVERRFVVPAEQVEPGKEITYPLDLVKFGLTLPRIIGDSRVDRRLNDARTLYYKLPQVYQQWIPSSKVKHENLALGSTHYSSTAAIWGIFKTSFLADFNANPDFPWETTFGLNVPHRLGMSIYSTINFMSLPEDEEGKLIPVAVLVDERPLKCLYPPGVMFGEVIYVEWKGKKYVQEIRTRTKSEDSARWFPGVYRPVRDLEEYQTLTRQSYEPGRKYMTFRNLEEDEVFKVEGTVERLPPLPEAEVIKLLNRPFQDVTTSGWHPCPDQDFHILPKDYSLGLIKEFNSEGCANCHRQTGISVRNLIPHEPKIQQNPNKVGNIRGFDGIFTWHPFSMLSVKEDATQSPGKEIYLRRFDVQSGVVQPLKRGQIPSHDYKLTLYVQESLKPYELPLDQRFLHQPKGSFKAPPEKLECSCGKDCDCKKGECKDKNCKTGKSPSDLLQVKADPSAQDPLHWKPYWDDRVVTIAPPSSQVVQVNVSQVKAQAIQGQTPAGSATGSRGLPMATSLPAGQYKWEYHSELDASQFPFRVLLRGNGKTVGVWDYNRQAYLPVNATYNGYQTPTQPPVPIPEELRRVK